MVDLGRFQLTVVVGDDAHGIEGNWCSFEHHIPLEQLCHYARTRHFGVQEVAHEVDRVGERTAKVRHAVVVGIYSPDAEKGYDCDDCD